MQDSQPASNHPQSFMSLSIAIVPLSVGVIGLGSLGTKRAAALRETHGGRLVAVADQQPDRAIRAATDFGVPALSTDDLLASEQVDVVLICTPNSSHAELSIAAMNAGKHVLCEKPIACSPAEGGKIAAAARETGRSFKMGSNHRYFRSVRAAYDLVQSNAIGQVLTMFCRIGHNGERLRDTWYWDSGQSGGGALLDTGCHVLDLCRWFMGDFTTCTGATSRVFWKEAGVEDTASGTLLTADGRLAVVTTSRRLFSGYLHIEINGSAGFAWLDARRDVFAADRLTWGEKAGRSPPQVLDFFADQSNSMVLELDDFFSAIQTGRKLTPDADDGLAILRITDALYSHQTTRIAV